MKAEAVPVKNSDGIYIIFTSGTTGLPKGVLRRGFEPLDQVLVRNPWSGRYYVVRFRYPLGGWAFLYTICTS